MAHDPMPDLYVPIPSLPRHDESTREVRVGDRFQKMRLNPLTGIGVQIDTYMVEAIEAEAWTGSRRIVMRRDDDGSRSYPYLDFLRQAGWKAIDNVLTLTRREHSCETNLDR